MEILNERDSLQRQCIEYKLRNENNTPLDTESVRREISEKSVTMTNFAQRRINCKLKFIPRKKSSWRKHFSPRGTTLKPSV